MSLPCPDTTFRDIHELVLNGLAFQNPLNLRLSLCLASGEDAVTCLNAKIAALNPLNPTYPADLANLTGLKSTVRRLVPESGEPTGPLGFMQAHTDFLSGNLPFFPLDVLQPVIGHIPNVALLTGMSFVGLLGLIRTISNFQKGICTFDPDNPCSGMNSIFSTILGGLNTAFDAINALLQSTCDVIADILELINKIEAFILQLINQITAEIQAMINFLMMAAAYGISKILQGLFFTLNKIDPCLATIVNQIATPALNTVLHPPSL